MSRGRFGIHGGQFIPETLMSAVTELEKAYEYYKKDPQFKAELKYLLEEYTGRPSRLYFAEKMTKDLGGARIYLKREDLNHTGSHKINNDQGYSRDRGRTARCGHCHRSCPVGSGMRGLHGQGGYGPPGT